MKSDRIPPTKQTGKNKPSIKATTGWNSGALLSLAVALVLMMLVVLGLNYALPGRFYSRVAIVAAVLLLILRQLMRRNKGRRSRAAEPDPQSRLNLQ